MLKREITFKNYITEEEQTKTFYFNLTETEVAEYEASYGGGIKATFQRIVDTQDPKQLLAEFQGFILLAYGERSEDGESFIKSDKLREAFKQHAAFNVLFLELGLDADKAAEFFIGVLPEEYVKKMNEIEPSLNPQMPPPIPSVYSTPSA